MNIVAVKNKLLHYKGVLFCYIKEVVVYFIATCSLFQFNCLKNVEVWKKTAIGV